MSLRKAKNKLSGYLTRQPEITLGYRTENGQPGVTVTVNYEKGYGCYTDPEVLRQLILDLHAAIKHLEGEDIASLLD